ncbi:hypothetical protein Taro_006255, partial [Colocasia esculenta]|nr:hypothetical protein [Colocasia esculenta]
PWLREVDVVVRRPVRTSRDVRSGQSSRPRHHRVLYFPHRRLWIMKCSCKVWCRPCRRKPTPRLHSRLSWRLRKVLEVRKQRPQDQGLSETSARSPARSASRSSGSGSSASYGKTKKALSPSSSLVGDRTSLEETVESDSERGE